MLKALIKNNIAAFFNWFTGGKKRSQNGKAGAKGKAVLYALLMLYVFGVFVWMFGAVFGLLAEPMYLAGSGWLYFVYVFIMAFAIMFIFSVFAAKNSLYEAKDNDLLLSLPIPAAYILGSRMAMLLAINLLSGLLVTAPAVYRWFSAAPFDALSLVYIIVLFLGLCLFALALSALFGWILSVLSSRAKKKTLFETLFSLAFLAAYFIVYMQINEIVQSLIANNAAITDSMSSVAPLYWIGSGAVGDTVSLLLGLAVLVVPFAVVYAVLSRTFIKTATSQHSTGKVKYEAKEQKQSSQSRALLRRETARFFSSSTCIINNGLGIVFLIGAAVALQIYKADISAALILDPELPDLALVGAVAIICLLAGMVQPTSCSVSLEGKSIWIAQSIPVSPVSVLAAKLKLCLIMYIPPVILCMLSAVSIISPDADTAALAILLSASVTVVMAEIGLISNVNHPALNWTTESQAVKSGAAVLLCMLYDIGIVAALGLGGALLLDAGIPAKTILTVCLVAALVAARLLWSHIVRRSAPKFSCL